MTDTSQRYLAVTLAVLWLLSTGLMLPGPMMTVVGQIAALAFIPGLVIHLWRDLPRPSGTCGGMIPTPGFGPTLAMILIALFLLFALGIVVHPWLVVIAALTLAALTIIVAFRRMVSRRAIALGLAACGLCLLLSGLSGRLDGFQAFYLATIPVLFMGGVVLAQGTGLGAVHCAAGAWGAAVRAFSLGGLLAVPAALLNSAGGAHSGDAWVDQSWEPLVALVPGIAEETWARLFLLTFVFALLRPDGTGRIWRAVIASILIAAIVHALAHLPGLMVFSPAALPALVNALVFGVPMGLLFIRYGFEAAVGYHVMIDFVRFLVALLQV